MRRLLAGIAVLLSGLSVVRAESALIAVASNFTTTAESVAAEFTRQTGHTLKFSAGSSGKLYAQASHGAPFDAFLSADIERAAELEAQGIALADSRFTYAVGRLTLWSAAPRFVGRDCKADLQALKFNKLALANPLTAPYGAAALQVLSALGLSPQQMEGKMVQGENIAQTLQFADSGSADLAFVALSQMQKVNAKATTCRWDVPDTLHDAIEQQAVLMAKSKDNSAARGYLEFLKSDVARALIERDGYAPAP